MREGALFFTLTLMVVMSYATAQDQVEDICYGTGSVVAAVIGTLVVALGLLAGGLFLYSGYWKTREGKHLMLVTDAENPNDQYAFDNPCFREATPIKHNLHEDKHAPSRLEKNKWLGWSPLNPFGKDYKTSEKITSLDDSYMNDPRLKVVSLKSHDFTGLGFNICGNMRDGIFIKDVLHRGPAFESGCISAGDRIDSVCISFRNMVLEDALAILSYASPYDVQVQVENDSYSRPSTLIRSKRESNALSSTDRILHPKYSRSQSITNLDEIGKTNNKRISHHVDYMQEKNRINHSISKSHEGSNDYPTIKLTGSASDPKKERQKLEKNAAPDHKKAFFTEPQNPDSQNKLQKFGIKVLPINVSPKPEDGPKPAMVFENEINSRKEKPAASPSVDTLKKKSNDFDDVDGSKENVKGILVKGFQNLKEKINQNTLGKKKNKEPAENATNVEENDIRTSANEKMNGRVNGVKEEPEKEDKITDISEGDCPVPKTRSSISGRVRENEKNKASGIAVPEEVSRAGDVARNNRKSLNDPTSCRKSLTSLISEAENTDNSGNKTKPARNKGENLSDSENSTDADSLKTTDETKKPKRSKGKAPAPPANETPKDGRLSVSPKTSCNDVNEIKKESAETVSKDKSDSQIINLKGEKLDGRSHALGYDSDSDTEPGNVKPKDRPNNTKIELTSTQVTVHQSSDGGENDDDIEPSRKAASLGDLSKLDSEQPLSVVLERAVSLDLADGASQSSKKRKAPLPPSDEFSGAFDDYRKEPRHENSLGMSTFQRRLKKSSDFGTLEDALNEGPKSLEIEINRRSSPSLSGTIDLTETHNSNIQEFSTWLAECRRPKSSFSETSGDETLPSRVSSTSLVNINSSEDLAREPDNENKYQGNNVSFSVNGMNFPEMQTISCEEQGTKFPGNASKTVVVISQPNSLEPGIVEAVPVNVISEDDKPENHFFSNEDEMTNGRMSVMSENDNDYTTEPFVTAMESRLENFDGISKNVDEPPKLPSSPMPVLTTNTLSSPLSSSLTYITEIKVSTTQQKNGKQPSSPKELNSSTIETERIVGLKTSTPKPEMGNSISKRIQQFDAKSTPVKPVISPLKSKPSFGFLDIKNGTGNGSPIKRENHMSYEPSRIPIKTMKSETGQKVLATIQSLASKDSVPTKIPEVEYAKRVASLFSGNSLERKHANTKKQSDISTSQPNVSGFYLKGPEPTTSPKPSKDLISTRKVPPTVPPRKLETSLSTKSAVTTVDLRGKDRESVEYVSGHSPSPGDKIVSKETQERNIVTFSSFIPKNQNEESTNSTLISFKIK